VFELDVRVWVCAWHCTHVGVWYYKELTVNIYYYYTGIPKTLAIVLFKASLCAPAYVHITGVLMVRLCNQAFCCPLPLSCSKPVCQMFGHTSPILSVHIDEEEEKIYSIAFDNCVKVRSEHTFALYSTYIHNAVDCIYLQYSTGLCACVSVCVCVCVCAGMELV